MKVDWSEIKWVTFTKASFTEQKLNFEVKAWWVTPPQSGS